ncbi:MAG TPA: copper chaperone [Gammaproteobacteria bacterium]|jgi:copper chaperone CopZ|nr:copper chaperone [Gammaproteobacteria bacterium]HIL42948.1 copper chaperone [Gammaproteobacteria bacterium]
MEIMVENIKCGGCTSTISKKLTEVFGVGSVEVNAELGSVTIDVDSSKRQEMVETLLSLGYPEIDSVHGFDSTKAKAKSFVSCAYGKMVKK